MVKLNSRAFFIVLLCISILFSSLTLWLLQSWVKYPLFVLEVATILVIYFIFIGNDVRLNLKQNKFNSLQISYLLSFLLIIFGVILLILHLLSFENTLPQLFLSLFITTFLPGFAIVNIAKLHQYLTKLEGLLLSYVLSFAVTGFLALILLSFGEQTRIIATLSGYIILGIVSVYCLYIRKTFTFSKEPSFSKSIDVFALLIAILFFAITFFSMYPGFALMPGTDITRHYNWCLTLNRSPQLYIGSAYLFSHLNQSTFLAVSDAQYLSSQLAQLSINLLLPVAFYVMAKRYLNNIHPSLPSVATLFWSLFTNSYGGFSWIYLAYLKLQGSTLTQLQLLTAVADKTYNGTLYGLLGLWYVPSTVSFLLLIAALFLLSKTDLSSRSFIALFSITVTILYLTHITEAVVLVTFLAVYGIFARKSPLNISGALKGALLAFLVIPLVYYLFSLFTSRFIFDTALMASIALPLLAVILSLCTRAIKLPELSKKIKPLRETRCSLLRLSVYALTFVYIIALVSWLFFLNSFRTSQVDSIGLVPWFVYPFILGITGLLSVAAINLVVRKPDEYNSLKFFIAFLFFVFLAGTLVSIMNLYFFNAGYWEKRFLWFIKIPLAILSPLPLLLLINKLKFTFPSRYKLISITLIGLVCCYGISTAFLNAEYWSLSSSESTHFATSNESSAISSLKDILNHDPNAWVATVTSTSGEMVTLAGPPDSLGLKQLLYNAASQELALTQLYRASMYSHAYLYINARDQAFLANYGDGFLANYLPTLSKSYENSEVSIYAVPALSYPQSNSETALIIPYDQSLSIDKNLVYDSLAYNNFNFTTVSDLDHAALNYSTLIVPFDPPRENYVVHTMADAFTRETLEDYSSQKGTWELKNQQLIGGNARGDEGIILYPVTADNFSISVNITPLIGNSSILNYASIVYSWEDAKNYRLADVFFSNDNNVYLLYRDFINGVERASPSWPGLKTNVTWAFEDTFNLKLTVSGENRVMSLNGTNLISHTNNVAGQVGVHYNRFFQVGFDDFLVEYYSTTFRPVTDYLNYVQSGGHLIILDKTGTGYFAQTMLSSPGDVADIQTINVVNGSKYSLPTKLSIPVTSANSDTTVLCYYGDSVSPLLVEKGYSSGGNVLYFNLAPINDAIYSSSQKSEWYNVVTNILKTSNLPEIVRTNPLSQLNGYAKSITSANTTVQTNSVLFSGTQHIGAVNVASQKGLSEFFNVTAVELANYSTCSIFSSSIVIDSGSGFYSLLRFNASFSINGLGNATLKITTADGNITYLDDVQTLSILPINSLNLYARTPEITSQNVTFSKLYLNNYPNLSVEVYGQDLSLTGFTQFTVAISDNYQAISDLTLPQFSGDNSQATQYTIFSNMPIFFLICLLLLPVALLILLVLKKLV
ncbi:MAG: hypothetical protein NWE92_08485 [Candidatus Bathyarchaeota archaeon]|nr:hypothetical protein [Candidatus Bathyarchaeota archaeon]